MAVENMSDTCSSENNVTFFYDLVGKNISVAWTTRDYVVVALGLTVCLIVVLSNLMVMVAIFMNRLFHYPIYYLLGNLAAADLFAGIAYSNLILNTGPWTRTLTKSQWYIRGALIDISLTASVANLLAVAVERHQTILTMQLHSKMSKRRVVLLIVCIWAVSIIMGLVPSLFWNCECKLSDCSAIAPLYSRNFLVFWAVLNFLSFIVMVAMYIHIFIYVRHWNQNMSRRTLDEEYKKTVVNLMKTIAMVLGAFVICWTPGLLVLLLDGLRIEGINANRYEKYCLVIAECNSLVNPIIYSLRDIEMRTTFKQILCCLRRRQPSPEETDSPLSQVASVRKSEEQVLCVHQDSSHKENSWKMPRV